MSSFLRELGLLETTGEMDVTHADHVVVTGDRQTLETMPRRLSSHRLLFPRTRRRSSSQVDSSPENSENVSNSPANLLEALKSPIPLDRASPEPNCSICLGKLQNKSFTNGCFHMFCFSCLLQWSKIKAECPLCKQSFKSIIHTVRSMQDYEEYAIPERVVIRDEDAPLTFTAQYQRRFPDNLTLAMHTVHGGLELQPDPFAGPTPFRYRTTMTARRPSFAEFYTHSWMLPVGQPLPTHHWRRRRHMGTAEFRQSVYVQDIWAHPPTDVSFRDCSAAFYRANPAQLHRLAPWLNRELGVLFHTTAGSYPVPLILDIILKYITRHEIRSPEFRRLLRSHIGFRTDHFLHEFYSFASSRFDLVGYDQAVRYMPNPNPPRSIHVSDESDSDIEIISSEPPPVPSSTLARDSRIPFLSGPSGSGARSSEEPVAGPSSARDESDECEVIGYVKPLHERTPEIIELSSEDEQPEQSGIRKTLQDYVSRSSPDSDILSSSTSSHHTSTSEYVPGSRKKGTKKVTWTKKCKQRESSDSLHSDPPQEELATTSTDFTRVTRVTCPKRRPSTDDPCQSRLDRSRKRAIVSYVRCGYPGTSPLAHPRMETLMRHNQPAQDANLTLESLNQSSSSVEFLGSTPGHELYSSSSLSASPFLLEDGETVSTQANHGSIGSDTMPQHGSDDWDDSDNVSESDISLALLKARTMTSCALSSTSRASTSGVGGANRELKRERRGSISAEPSSSATSVITSVGNVTSGPDTFNGFVNGRKPPKRLRSAIVPGTSTSARNEHTEHKICPWQLKQRLPILDSDDSSESDSHDSKPRIKSIVVTRNFTPVSQGPSSSRSSEDSRKRHKKKARWGCKHRESSASQRGKKNAQRNWLSSDSSS